MPISLTAMVYHASPHARTAAITAPLPASAHPRGGDLTKVDAAFSAGIALK
ncbi:hypothetical protein [Martelella limonii]|uniref:hypothetical protein n=1 Tax=Martelella limonii TaxID=1647649 RepID=UPI001580ECCC|nr:hypothetical protein [Martelella limonii]